MEGVIYLTIYLLPQPTLHPSPFILSYIYYFHTENAFILLNVEWRLKYALSCKETGGRVGHPVF